MPACSTPFRPASSSTPRSAKPTSPARSGSRLRFCTFCAAAGPAPAARAAAGRAFYSASGLRRADLCLLPGDLHRVLRTVSARYDADRAVPQPKEDRGALRTTPLVRSLVVIGLVVLIGLAPIWPTCCPNARRGPYSRRGRRLRRHVLGRSGRLCVTHPAPPAARRHRAHRLEQLPAPARRQPMAGQQRTASYIGLGGAGAGAAGAVDPAQAPGCVVLGFVGAAVLSVGAGPSLRIAGHDTGIPGPFRILQELPFFKGNRYPSRFSVMLLISAAPLVAMGAPGCSTGWRHAGRPGTTPRASTAV